MTVGLDCATVALANDAGAASSASSWKHTSSKVCGTKSLGPGPEL
jgi:hypothetical protein